MESLVGIFVVYALGCGLLAGYIAALPDAKRRADAEQLVEMMQRISGEPPRMWGATMIGFGRYRYTYDSGHGGEAMRLGFAPRGSETVLYLARDYPRFDELAARLGRHRAGKSCLYVRSLAAIDTAVLEEMVRETVTYMDARYPRG